MTGCIDCGAPLGRRNKSGRCRSHFAAFNSKQESTRAAMSAGVKAAHARNPEILDANRARLAAYRTSPEGRQRASALAKANRPWEKAFAPSQTPESKAKRGAAISATKLAHIPREYRDEYKQLVQRKIPKVEATAIILAQAAADLARFRREIGR